ncbi:MAG TPA: hypothetical protein VNZ43_12040 [Sphingomonadaceae bacterium]|jgi:hypothetical protein|nr:hypothetical protein [Sphingomonadaceae bacterium]
MVRLVIGSIAGGIAQFLVTFLFWWTPLSRLAFSVAGDPANADLQRALARNLTQTGTGTYAVPWTSTQQGTTLFGQGPIATIHFNIHGFPVIDTGTLLGALILSIITAFLIGLALHGVAARVAGFADRVRLVVLFALAAALYLHLGQPVLHHYGWRYFVYLTIGDALGLIAAGIVIARWFLPRPPLTP